MPDNIETPEIRALIQSGYRYALSLTHHRHDAEDLIQQACLKPLRSNGRLVSKSYLFTAVRNLYIDRQRKRSEIELLETATEQLLGALRSEEREVLYLSYVEGYTAAEIADLTGQPRGTVLSHLSRAKKHAQEKQKSDATEEVQ